MDVSTQKKWTYMFPILDIHFDGTDLRGSEKKPHLTNTACECSIAII